ncbi:MAG: thiamine pyrophosphate-binding protein [Euzebyales bacterium]|nr:thiamine pyrophosphate-binding protein [Euzebyales bacterium]
MTAIVDAVVDRLVAVGVRRAYTVPGESFLPLLDACAAHPDITLVSTRHESGAAFMAEADAKLTGVPALAMATRGVGAANLAIGVHTAYQDSTPMIVLLGQVESSFLGREAFQEVDLPAFYGEITKWAATVPSADRFGELLDRALRVATSGRPGPVMLAIPSDVMEEEADPAPGWSPGVTHAGRPALDLQTARLIHARLRDARAPVVIAGGGAQGARAALVAFAERCDVGVYAAFRRQDVFPNDHPHYCGHLALGTPPETLKALQDADLVMLVGSRLSEITTQGYTLPTPDQAVIQIDIDPRSVGAVLQVEIGAVADAGAALATLVEHAPDEPPDRDWSAVHDAYLAASTPAELDDTPLHPATVMAALTGAFPASTIVTNDAGNFSVFGHRYWRFTQPRTQLGPTSGAMGYAVPAAIAAALADPEREVLALVGDGGFLMTGQEMETAVRHELPMTVVVFHNGLYGTIALHQARSVGHIVGVDIGDVDIAAVARGYGAEAWQATTRASLDAALREARACGRPAVVDVLCDPDVLTPSARLSQLLEG